VQFVDYGILWSFLLPAALIAIGFIFINRRLSDEIERRISAEEKARTAMEQLEMANDQLKLQNDELDAYAHTIAHSLKTPLAATGNFLDILTKYRSEDLSEEQLHLANQAISSMKMGNETVEALLMLSTVSKEQIKEEPLDMEQLVQRALDQLQDEQERVQASISLPASWPSALGYAPWVGEVWLNYLSNALKYSGAPTKVKVGGELNGQDLVRFWVQDAGRPLTNEQRQQLFVPFARLHEELGPGHGLGLTITQRIIERLGGEVGVTSISGVGNEFYFTLPAAPSMPPK
jgi:two-component system sensor histidine kinase/response regulator